MKKNILSVIGAATVAAVALKLTTKYVKNEVIKELEDDGYLSPDCVLNTSIGKYSGKIINASTSSYGSALPIAMAVFTEDQKKEINQYFVDCANSVFDMMRTGADRDSYSAYLLDSNAVSAIFDVDGDDKQAAIANEANAVSRIEVLSAESVAGYPDAYIYHFSSSDSITMNIRYNAVLSSGEYEQHASQHL